MTLEAESVFLCVDRDPLTHGIQISINVLDERGSGHGYRIAGPKYLGNSEQLVKYRLTARDAAEISRYLAQIDSPASEA